MSLPLDRRPVIVGDTKGRGIARTAFVKAFDPRIVRENQKPTDFLGALPEVMLATLFDHIIDSAQIDPEAISCVLTGTAHPEDTTGMDVARMAVLASKRLPITTPGSVVSTFCISSMVALANAADMIVAGRSEAVIASGAEKMSGVPMGGWSTELPSSIMTNFLEGWLHMGRTAENLAIARHITRKEQEEFAIMSHYKAADPANKIYTASTIVSFKPSDDADFVSEDQLIRVKFKKKDGVVSGEIGRKAYARAVRNLKPAFDDNGTVTAATSAGLADGATAVLVTSAAFAKACGLPILAEIVDYASAGCDPAFMGLGPIDSTEKLFKRTGRTIGDIGPMELNEAFSSQALCFARHYGFDPQRLNVWGGALAFGHPLGASALRITPNAGMQLAVPTLFPEKDHALVAQCAAAGMGMSVLLKRFEP